jgi:hypothetical protein
MHLHTLCCSLWGWNGTGWLRDVYSKRVSVAAQHKSESSAVVLLWLYVHFYEDEYWEMLFA